MAGTGRNWTNALAVAMLLVGSGQASLAQSVQSEVSGSLAGKLTDLYSKPLEGVAVVLRNQSTGAEARTTTKKNGAYRFSGLEPGEYALEAESTELGHGQVEEIMVAGGHEAQVQTAIDFVPLPRGPLLAASHEAEPFKAKEQLKTPLPIPKSAPALVGKPALKVEPPQTVARLVPVAPAPASSCSSPRDSSSDRQQRRCVGGGRDPSSAGCGDAD